MTLKHIKDETVLILSPADPMSKTSVLMPVTAEIEIEVETGRMAVYLEPIIEELLPEQKAEAALLEKMPTLINLFGYAELLEDGTINATGHEQALKNLRWFMNVTPHLEFRNDEMVASVPMTDFLRDKLQDLFAEVKQSLESIRQAISKPFPARAVDVLMESINVHREERSDPELTLIGGVRMIAHLNEISRGEDDSLWLDLHVHSRESTPVGLAMLIRADQIIGVRRTHASTTKPF